MSKAPIDVHAIAAEAAALAAEELELEAEERALAELEAKELELEEALLRDEENSLIRIGISPFKVRLPEHLEEGGPSSPLRKEALPGGGAAAIVGVAAIQGRFATNRPCCHCHH